MGELNLMPLLKNMRFEVIDEKGRQYVKYGVDITLSFQDSNQTLKIFIKENQENNHE